MLDPTGTLRLRAGFRRAAVLHVNQWRKRLRSFESVRSLEEFIEFALATGHAEIVGDWIERYINQAYASGQKAAYALMRAYDDFGWRQPSTLYRSVVVSELKGIIAATVQQMARVVADGLMTRSFNWRALNLVITKIAINRLNALCNMTIVKLHNVGRLDAFSEHGVIRFGIKAEGALRLDHVDVRVFSRKKPPRLVEVITAGDDRVCPICEDLEGQVYTYAEAIGLLPRHPHCRCAVIPHYVHSDWNPDQPRAPAGTSEGGQWTSNNLVVPEKYKVDETGLEDWKSQIESFFPNLRGTDYKIVGRETDTINCIGWAFGRTDFVFPDAMASWPFNNAFGLKAFDELMKDQLKGHIVWHGVEEPPGKNEVRLALYAKGVSTPIGRNIEPTHMARQLPDGNWVSKCGSHVFVQHPTLESMEGDTYGRVLKVYSLGKKQWQKLARR